MRVGQSFEAASRVARRRGACWMLTVACVGVISGADARGAANLLTNGNFDASIANPGSPDNWSQWNFGSTAFAAWKGDPANDPFDADGTPYVNAGNYGDWWSSGGGWYQEVPAAEGTAYTLTVDCASEGWDAAAGELRIIFLDDGNHEIVRNVFHTAHYQANIPWSAYTLTATAPSGTFVVKAELATWGARGAVLWDNANLQAGAVWTPDENGNWTDGTKWQNGVPNNAGDAARFQGPAGANRTITLSENVTVGSLGFENANSFTLNGTGSLKLQTASGLALIDAKAGTHTVRVPITFASNGHINVYPDAALVLAGPVTVEAGKHVSDNVGIRTPSEAPPGPLVYQAGVTLQEGAGISFGASQHLTSLTLAANATAALKPRSVTGGNGIMLTLDAITSAAGGKIDVADNALTIAYAGAAGRAAVLALLQSGYDHGKWDGAGVVGGAGAPGGAIVSTVAAARTDGAASLGYSDSGGALTIRYTWTGDANLDGKVDAADAALVAAPGTANATWKTGDFNYDGKISPDDFALFALGASLQGAALPAVPEPGTIGTATLVGLSLLARRRRRA